jgi:Cys-tRNA(Pro)/Cys-tRNA(Cys) deacylase
VARLSLARLSLARLHPAQLGWQDLAVMSGGTPATAALDRAGVSYTLHSYAHDSRAGSYGEEAAALLGIDPDRIFKTLIAIVDNRLVCAVVPVSSRLSLKALASAAGGRRADLADPARAQRATGYVLGGISPFGHKSAIPVLVDSSVTGLETVFVSAGKRGLQVELAPTDLLRLTGGSTAPIATG